jgi:hypothetical protein
MAGSLINTYTQLDTDILALQLTSDANFVGKHNVSLTNYDTTGVPAIAAGSIVECNGALFEFTADEAVTGTPSNGTVYIQIVPSTTTCTAAFTNTAPTWSDAKQGFYGTGAAANYRYLEFEMTRSSATVYSNKHTITHDDNVKLDIISATTANITTAKITTLLYVNGITRIAGVLESHPEGYGRITAPIENVPERWLHNYTGTTTENEIYSFFGAYVDMLQSDTYYRLHGTLHLTGDPISTYLILNGFKYISSTKRYRCYGSWSDSGLAGYLEIIWGGSNTYIASMVF